MSLYANYINERTFDYILEDDFGFATYRFINDNGVYLIDLYVVPEKRQKGLGKELVRKVEGIAKKQGCIFLLGTVVPTAKNSTESLKVMFSDPKMKLLSSSNDIIVFRKEL